MATLETQVAEELSQVNKNPDRETERQRMLRDLAASTAVNDAQKQKNVGTALINSVRKRLFELPRIKAAGSSASVVNRTSLRTEGGTSDRAKRPLSTADKKSMRFPPPTNGRIKSIMMMKK